VAERADPGGIDRDREALLGVLAHHGVAFVLIGGAAIQSYGRRYDTQDIDLTPDTTPENLARLADALKRTGLPAHHRPRRCQQLGHAAFRLLHGAKSSLRRPLEPRHPIWPARSLLHACGLPRRLPRSGATRHATSGRWNDDRRVRRCA
jgi:hypothetical protein